MVLFVVFVLILYAPVNNISVLPGRGFLSQASTKHRIKCLTQGHNAELRNCINFEINHIRHYNDNTGVFVSLKIVLS